MIDHISLPVRSLERSVPFYETALGALGYQKLVARERTVGFGKGMPSSG